MKRIYTALCGCAIILCAAFLTKPSDEDVGKNAVSAIMAHVGGTDNTQVDGLMYRIAEAGIRVDDMYFWKQAGFNFKGNSKLVSIGIFGTTFKNPFY